MVPSLQLEDVAVSVASPCLRKLSVRSGNVSDAIRLEAAVGETREAGRRAPLREGADHFGCGVSVAVQGSRAVPAHCPTCARVSLIDVFGACAAAPPPLALAYASTVLPCFAHLHRALSNLKIHISPPTSTTALLDSFVPSSPSFSTATTTNTIFFYLFALSQSPESGAAHQAHSLAAATSLGHFSPPSPSNNRLRHS